MKINYANFDPANPKTALTREIGVTVAKVEGETGDMLDIRASDQTLDRYNEVILASGWRLGDYLKNPVIQNSHQYGDILHTIGRAVSTEVRGTELVQRWEFASGVNPIAKIASGLYRGGFLKACSVGFLPRAWTNGKNDDAASRTYTEQDLLEVSAVGIPANPNALTLAFEAGAVEKSDLKELNDLLTKICGKESIPQGNERAPALADHGAQLIALARTTAGLMRRL